MWVVIETCRAELKHEILGTHHVSSQEDLAAI